MVFQISLLDKPVYYLYLLMFLIGISLLVLVSEVKNKSKNGFFYRIKQGLIGLGFSISMWSLLAVLIHIARDISIATFFTRLAFGLALVAGVSIFHIFLSFLDEKSWRRYKSILIPLSYTIWVLFLFLVFFVVVTPGVIKVATLYDPENGVREGFVAGDWFVFWGGFALLFMGILLWTIAFVVRHSVGTNHEKVKLLIGSLVISILLVGFFNLILPLLGYKGLYDIGILSLFMVLLSFTYITLEEFPYSFRFVLARLLSFLTSGIVLFLLSWGVQRFEQFVLKWDITQAFSPAIWLLGIFVASWLSFFIYKFLKLNFLFWEKTLKIRSTQLEKIINHLLKHPQLEGKDSLVNTLKTIKKQLRLDGIYVNLPCLDMEWATNYELFRDFRRIKDKRRIRCGEMCVLKFREPRVAILIFPIITVEDDKIPSKVNGFEVLQGKVPGVVFWGAYFSKEELPLFKRLGRVLRVLIMDLYTKYSLERENQRLEVRVYKRTKELNKALADLKKAYARLKELDDAKSQFIRVVSHQLRTPITVILGYLQMIMKGELGSVSDPLRDALNRIYMNAIRLRNLIEDVLNINILELGRLKLVKEPVDIIALLQDIVSNFRAEAHSKGLELIFINRTLYPKFHIMADRSKLTEALSNLVDNAVKYTKHGWIEVGFDRKGDSVLIWVKDTGIGIPEEHKSKVFEKFIRLSNAKKMVPDGTGIGLYLAKQIIEAHGGKIWFESEVGKGTTFYVRLPVGKTEEGVKHRVQIGTRQENSGKR